MVSRILQSGLSLGEDSETEDDFAQNCGGVVYSGESLPRSSTRL